MKRSNLIRLIPRKPRTLLKLCAVVAFFTLLFGDDSSLHRRNQALLDPDDVVSSMRTRLDHNNRTATSTTSDVPWNGIKEAEWCMDPKDPPLPYDDCKWNSFLFEFGVHGGLTNALHFILKGE